MPEITIGKKSPLFNFVNESGEKENLSGLVGEKGLVLYFYPKDMTPGCTTEACDFRDNFSALKKMGFNVAGISRDDSKSHEKFRAKYSLPFTLIPDPEFNICKKYGVYRDKKFMGRVGKGIVRTTILLDKNMKILKIYDEVKVKAHVEQIKKDILELTK